MSLFFDKSILASLEQLGLSPKEATVYTSLLLEGPLSGVRISQKIDLHRQFVYNALNSLELKGLAIKLPNKTWKASSPRNLISIAEENQNKAISTSDKLISYMSKAGGQEFEIIQGRMAFRKYQIDVIKKIKPNETIYMICGQWDKYFEEIGEYTYAQWEKIRIKKNITNKIIGPKKLNDRINKFLKKYPSTDCRYIEGLDTGLINTIIYENTVDFEIYGEPHITFSVHNQDVADGQKIFFKSLWDISQK